GVPASTWRHSVRPLRVSGTRRASRSSVSSWKSRQAKALTPSTVAHSSPLRSQKRESRLCVLVACVAAGGLVPCRPHLIAENRVKMKKSLLTVTMVAALTQGASADVARSDNRGWPWITIFNTISKTDANYFAEHAAEFGRRTVTVWLDSPGG